jgi:hypothetical protein
MSFNINFSGCPLMTAPISIETNILTNEGFMSIETFLAKNGKFGKDCRETDSVEKKDYFGNVVPGETKQLCAYDKSLTLEKVKEKTETQNKFFSRDLRDHVEYSY